LAIAYADGRFDLDFGDGGTAIDEGLRTAVIISLFSDRRAEADDALPDGGDDRRGWWGDIYPQAEADRIGSRLWLLSREKQLPAVLKRAETYAREALQWLVDDGEVTDLTVVGSIPNGGVLGLTIRFRTVERGETVAYRVVAPTAVSAGAILDEAGGAILDESGAEILE